MNVSAIETLKGGRKLKDPTAETKISLFGKKWKGTEIDRLLLEEEFSFSLKDGGFRVMTDAGKFDVVFDKEKYRPTDVPILLSDTSNIRKLGYSTSHSVIDIVGDQLNYYADQQHRRR